MLRNCIHDSDVDKLDRKYIFFELFFPCDFDQNDLLFVLFCVVDKFIFFELERNFLYFCCFVQWFFDVTKFRYDALYIDRRGFRSVIFDSFGAFVDIFNQANKDSFRDGSLFGHNLNLSFGKR
jgi:hypothetical protein